MTAIQERIRELSDQEFLEAYQEVIRYEKDLGLLLLQKETDKHEAYRKTIFTKELASESVLNFTRYTYPKYRVNDHHEIVGEYLDRWVNKEIPYLIIVEPPRHGKTEQVSRRTPAYIFGKNPDARVIAATYAADYAKRTNRDVQRIMDSPYYHEIFPKVSLPSKLTKEAAKEGYVRNATTFEIVNHSGSYICAGRGGPITGMGFDYGIIDDPLKNAEEAFSKTIRDSLWNWYISTFLTRMEENGSILITATRWHEDDLIGRLLAHEPGKWVVLEFPAIKDTPLEYNDYDFRVEGEALWIGKYNIEALESIKESLGEYWWSALYQGRPSPEGGGIIKPSYFQYYDQLPPPSTWIRVVQSWDTAFKKRTVNDFNVGTTWIETKVGYYLWHVWRKRAETPEVKRMVLELYNKYHAAAVLIEDKASGQGLIQEFKRTKLPIIAVPVDVDKISRAAAASPTIEAGNVYLPAIIDEETGERAEHGELWFSDFVQEVSAFPKGKNDDQVDSMTQAINYMKGNLYGNWEEQMDKIEQAMEEKTVYDMVKTGDWKGIQGVKEEIPEEPKEPNVYEKVFAMNQR